MGYKNPIIFEHSNIFIRQLSRSNQAKIKKQQRPKFHRTLSVLKNRYVHKNFFFEYQFIKNLLQIATKWANWKNMDYKRDLESLYTNFEALITLPEFSQVSQAVELIRNILVESRLQNVYVSFNGGKDATVALFLTFFAMRQLGQQIKINCLYFEESEPFEEVTHFMNAMKKMLNLSINALRSKKYQVELTNFDKKHPIDYIMMGSRKDDPGCGNLSQIAISDVHKGYPEFKRVNPVIDWDYSFLWKFINEFHIPYCKLYNEGYTSLGNKKNTKKNQALYNQATKTYQKAHLASQQVERHCRMTKV